MNLQQGSSDRFLRIGWWVLFGLAVGVVVLIRIRLLEIPLERDEGEYAYTGQLMLQGVPPYMLAYSMKFPGTAAAYALIMLVFGQTTVAVHLGLLVLNMATVALIFFLGRRLFDEVAGIAAGATYAILSVSPTVLGSAAHARSRIENAAISCRNRVRCSGIDEAARGRVSLFRRNIFAFLRLEEPGRIAPDFPSTRNISLWGQFALAGNLLPALAASGVWEVLVLVDPLRLSLWEHGLFASRRQDFRK
jgi:hypothetical protein